VKPDGSGQTSASASREHRLKKAKKDFDSRRSCDKFNCEISKGLRGRVRDEIGPSDFLSLKRDQDPEKRVKKPVVDRKCCLNLPDFAWCRFFVPLGGMLLIEN